MNDSEIIEYVEPFTCLSRERLQNILDLVGRVIQENIPGDLAEVGVWRGGAIMVMALKCKQMGVVREIHAYDTFTGMTTPTNVDIDVDGIPASQIFEAVKCEVSLEDVMRNMEAIDYPHITYHVGDIVKTNISALPTFALLHLDTDWYESTKFELTYMEPRVSPYGFIIVDDYGHWQGSRKAVEEFCPPALHKIDYTGVWWQRDFGRSRLDTIDSPIAQVLHDNFHHFIALGPSFHRGCGSYLFDGQTYVYQPDTLKKQEALYDVGTKSTRVLEIGVYLGHSLLLLLLSNPTLRIVCIDNDPTFSPAAVQYLNEQFGNRIEFHLGDSATVLANTELGQFDCIHIDADHREEPVRQEFTLTRPLASPNAYFVFDDYEALQPLIDSWIQDGTLTHVSTPGCLWTNVITRINNVSS